MLRALQEQPRHGYEIIKALEDRFQGFYKPSAGAVYPALRSLLKERFVAVDGGERRRTYRISAKGRAFLRRHESEVEKRYKSFEDAVGPERAAMFRELRSTGRLLVQNMRSITPEQAVKLRKVVVELRTRIMRIFAE